MPNTKSEMKCVDALTCLNAFIHHFRSHKDEDDLKVRMTQVFELCDNYGLVPKTNTFNLNQ